jgi:hypothetical protein
MTLPKEWGRVKPILWEQPEDTINFIRDLGIVAG